MLFGWKKRIVRLHTTVLASAPLHEIDPKILCALEMMRSVSRGTANQEDLERVLAEISVSPSPFLWEPITLFGWDLTATMYLQDGKPWWLVRAHHAKDEPSEKEMAMIRTAIDYLGADVERDRLMNRSFGSGLGYSMWWTWINQAPMLTRDGNGAQMQVVQEGTAVKPGWERVDRNRITRGVVASSGAESDNARSAASGRDRYILASCSLGGLKPRLQAETASTPAQIPAGWVSEHPFPAAAVPRYIR